jgi:hypothetical protein
VLKTGQIKEVYFERVFNLGNYGTFRLGLHATVGAGQTVEGVVADLDAFTIKIRNRKMEGKTDGRDE